MTPGAVWKGRLARFSLYSAHATAVELCLFDGEPGAWRERRRIELERSGDEGLWVAEDGAVGPGQAYGYRVHGPFEPRRGHRFNPAKLLADPAARGFAGELTWNDALRGSWPAEGGHEEKVDPTDSAPWVPRSLVVDESFDWRGDRPPAVPWADTVIYECHVRGMTRLHPEVTEGERGTYLGLASEPVIEHLHALGVTAVELLPVQQIAAEEHLLRSGRPNYFGYSPLGWFAPHAGYAAGGGLEAAREFRRMVRRLHRAGIEVLVDVVFNHTAEGDHRGPTLCLKGIDNRGYYLPDGDDLSRYANYSGCGNTLDPGQPACRALILAALRHWVESLHVDGFRFDLAPTLGRDGGGPFDRHARLFEELRRDPVLGRVKLIAEPWDLGPDGYRLGGFADEWSEWNDRFRDAARSFWRGDPGAAAPLRAALAGSSAIFAARRPPRASINYVTAHDGFTLTDLVSYEHRHNEANGEGNRDGHAHNLSRNWGIEGPSDSRRIREIRGTVQRSLLATLALAAGTPMLSHGDELGRTQLGNNNAYCQDNEVTWVHWPDPAQPRPALADFLARALELRRAESSLRPERWEEAEVRWLAADGGDLGPHTAPLPYFAGRLAGRDGPLVILFNGDSREHLFRLPGEPGAGRWRLLLDSAGARPGWLPGASARLAPHSLQLVGQRPAGAGRRHSEGEPELSAASSAGARASSSASRSKS